MAKTVKLEIISPDKIVFKADVEMLVLRSTAGELGILPRHAPMIAGLVPHVMRAKIDGKDNLIACAGGFVEVKPDHIVILASAAELPIEIDVNRAQRAYERAQRRMEEFKKNPELHPDFDFTRAQLALHRAIARLQATGSDISRE